MHNLSCENEFYLHENEKWFPHQRLSTYPSFETETRGNSEMAYYGKRVINYSALWGCAGDRIEMVVKVHRGTVLGDELAAMLKMYPPKQSHNALWQPSRSDLPRNLKLANGVCTYLFLVEIVKLFIIENLGAICEDSSDHIVTSNNHPTKQSTNF